MSLTATRSTAHPALGLFGAPLTIDVWWIAGLALGTWTFADGLLPAAVEGRGALAYWTAGAAGALLALASVALHEAGHCLAARRLGRPPRRVTLSLFGGITEFAGDLPPAIELRVALAGPAASVLGALAAAILHVIVIEANGDALAAHVLAAVALGNLLLAVINVLPAWPLDGGRALRAALAWTTGNPTTATAVTRTLGRGLGLALVLLAIVASSSGETPTAIWSAFLGLVLTRS